MGGCALLTHTARCKPQCFFQLRNLLKLFTWPRNNTAQGLQLWKLAFQFHRQTGVLGSEHFYDYRMNVLNLKFYLQMTAHRAFQFCKQYKRTTEFRRLCEIIRNHLANLNKYRDQRDRPDLSAPESLQLYLDTRFEQLKIATELELWQVCIFNVFLHCQQICV